jgi:hypothetical protein
MLCAASLGGCGESSKDLSESSIYPSPSDQKRFRDALTSERVPHKVHIREDGKEEIRWNPQYSDRVEAIDKRLFGTAPTMGRNVALDSAEMQRFESALRDRGIPYEKTTYHGRQFLSWNQESDAIVLSELERIAPTSARGLKEFRTLVQYK